MRDRIKLILVTGGGTGLLPKAPGTWGSLIPLMLVLVCGHFGLRPTWLLGLLIAIIVASSIFTIILAPWYTKYFSQNDPPQVVSDEIAGQSIALLGIAWLDPGNQSPIIWIGMVLLGFVLFRLFDIWKPAIINRSQELPGGWGVLVDDILAGIVAGAIVLACTTLLA